MNPSARVKESPRRALILGPAFAAAEIGGVQIALTDLAAQLRARGWQVDLQIRVAPAPLGQTRAPPNTWAAVPAKQSLIDQHPALFAAWLSIIPAWLRYLVSPLLKSRAYFEHLSHNLSVAERMVAEARRYDVVLLCVAGAAPGLAALLTDRLEQVVIISLPSLALEMKAGSFRWARFLARRRLGRQAHPYLYRPVAPESVRLALFGSAQWQREAIQAGLPPDRARTIYFGIPQPPPLPRPAEARHRILMVGRLSPEKGMHRLLRALPIIRASINDVTVTIVAGPGPTGYRRLLMKIINAKHIQDVVTLLPSMEREALPTVYASHDVLFFYSMFAEPVALVLMEAYAAGIPVVASQAGAASALVRDRLTCLCYNPKDTRSVAQAMIALLTDPGLGRRLAANAQRLVREEFSLEAMGQAYDAVLRGFIGARRPEAIAAGQ